MYTLIPFLKSVIKSLTHFCKMLHTSFRKTRIAVKRFNKKRKEGKNRLLYMKRRNIFVRIVRQNLAVNIVLIADKPQIRKACPGTR